MTTRTKKIIAIVVTTIVVTRSVVYMREMAWWNRYGSSVGQRKYVTSSYAKRIGLAISMYAADNDDCLPMADTKTAWQALLRQYGATAFESHNPQGGSIVPNPRVAGGKLSYLREHHLIVAFEQKRWEEGERVFLFADGKVKFLKEAPVGAMGTPSR